MKRFLSLVVCLVCCGGGAFAADGQSVPDKAWLSSALGDGYGVQVKEARTSDGELKKIKEAGLSYVRFVIPWYAVERGKGSFVWGYFDSFVERLREHGLKAVIVIGAGHPSYTKTIRLSEENLDQTDEALAAPSSDEEIKAFAHYAATTVEHFKGDDIVWELWNEPDSDRFWAPRANVQDYIRVMDAACHAMRAVAPNAHIIGPGMADTSGRFGSLIPGFLGKVLLSPVSSCLDAVSVHPYRDGEKPPETVLSAYEKLRTYVKAFTPKGQKVLPVVATEWGFTLTDTSEEDQAAFLLRSFLLNSLSKVPLSIWYEWRDARAGDDDPEAHFGLLTLKRKEKPSYKALASFLPPLKGARVEKRLPVGGESDFILQLRRPDGSRALVFWSAAAQPETKIMLHEKGAATGAVYALSSMPQTVDAAETVSVEVVP